MNPLAKAPLSEALRHESEKLTRSWSQHEAAWLRDYLVAGVEDPRINVQSILTRHFLVRQLFEHHFTDLMAQEIRFAGVMNWLIELAAESGDIEQLQIVLHALKLGSDNAEGVLIPAFVLKTFVALPVTSGALVIPNYIELFLTGTRFAKRRPLLDNASLDIFQKLWTTALRSSALPSTLEIRHVSVIEPACGSANDYRFVQAYGIAGFLDYSGFDLCPTNIENAKKLLPKVRFEQGNVFDIAASDQSFELCLIHDLFEHLSLEGLQMAIQEVCRVTRRAICIGFFQMDEIPNHIVRPVSEYHWNLLSMAGIRESFAQQGFASQIVHIGTFLRNQIGCHQTHNANAYTFLLQRLR